MHESLRGRVAWWLVVGLALVVALPGGVAAQTASGNVEGRVVDADGAALAGVTVTATNGATGLTRTTRTGADGTYRLPALPIGSYDLRFEREGFGRLEVSDVQVRVAARRVVDTTLEVATVEEVITVSSEPLLVATSPALGTVVSQQELENLPINDRQFANLGALAPGTSLGINPDPTKVGKLVIGLNGGSGRNVNFLVDGGDNTDDTIGGQLQNFSLESVAEFNIQTQQYKAEYGRTTGGVLTVVTKSGTNELAGSLFGFFRDDSLNTKTETQRRTGADKPPFERAQYGFSIGGPLVADRAHYFVSGERLDQDAPYTVNTGGIFPELDGRSFGVDTGNDLLTAKLTFQASPEARLQLRYGYQETDTTFGPGTTVTPTALGDLTNEFSTLLAGWDHVLSANSLNQLSIQYSDFENLILPVSAEATQRFPGGVISGQNPNTPQQTIQKKWHLRNDFSHSRELLGRRHDFKAGLEYVDESTLGGFFAPGKEGDFTRVGAGRNAPVSQILFFAGDFKFSTPNDQIRVYVQDDWQVTDRVTLNLGLRYDYTDVLDLDQRSNPIWQALSSQTTARAPHFADFLNGGGGKVEASRDDISPRLGFTWDVSGTRERVVRGGWGIFYDFPYTNATVLFPVAAVISDFGLAYLNANPTGILNPDGSFFQPGDPLPPNLLPGGGTVFPPNEVASPTLATPKAEQASIGYSHQLTPWLAVTVDLVHIEYSDLPFRFRANPIDPATGQRLFPQFGNFRLWQGGGSADYDGINLGVRGRLADRFELQGFYTYSEAEGNIIAGADEFRLTAGEHQPDLGAAPDVSVDPLNPFCSRCFGPLNVDARHRVTFSGLYRAPFEIQLGAMFRYRSALPYTVHAGVDLNRDGFNLDLPADVPHVNSARGASISQLDLRVSRDFSLGDRVTVALIAEMFNVFDEENPVRFVGNRSAPNFGQPTAFAGDPGQGEQRQTQLGVRFRF
jgi:outer membrane receptor protein involved in Fe transport